MAKRKKVPLYVKKIRQAFGRKLAQETRKRHKKDLNEVLKKGKVETYGDVYAIVNGLSGMAKRIAVAAHVLHLASFHNMTPQQIIENLEPKKEQKKKANAEEKSGNTESTASKEKEK